jgi:hypothetical protein
MSKFSNAIWIIGPVVWGVGIGTMTSALCVVGFGVFVGYHPHPPSVSYVNLVLAVAIHTTLVLSAFVSGLAAAGLNSKIAKKRGYHRRPVAYSALAAITNAILATTIGGEFIFHRPEFFLADAVFVALCPIIAWRIWRESTPSET